MRALVSLALVLGLGGFPSFADTDLDARKALLAARNLYPATDVRNAYPTPLPGIFEFDMGGETVYGDISARYLILGRLLDMHSPELAPIDYGQVAAQAFILQEGSAGELVLISDPSCSYCVAFERRLQQGELADFRIKVILTNLLGSSGQQIAGILCAPDPAKAYRDFMLLAKPAKACSSELVAIHARAAKLARVRATPTFLAPSGRVKVGLPAPGELARWVAQEQL